MYLSWAYGAMMRGNALNVDDYTGTPASFKDRVSVALAHWCVLSVCLCVNTSYKISLRHVPGGMAQESTEKAPQYLTGEAKNINILVLKI